MQTALDGQAADRRRARPASYELIELLFFAYRDFVGDPDSILERYGFGRAHHRVLHFVNRNPGLTIAALLDILKITKQSLGRVLKELLEQGYRRAARRLERPAPAAALSDGAGQGAGAELAHLQTMRIAARPGRSGSRAAADAARRSSKP